MRSTPAKGLRPGRVLPSVLLAVLLAGSALHVVHHLTDADCENGAGANSHPCLTCAAFHSVHAGVTNLDAAPPLPIPAGRAYIPAVQRLAAVLILAACSRAPPAA